MQSRRERHAYAQQLQRPRFGKRVTPGHAKLALRACLHVALHEPIVVLLTNLVIILRAPLVGRRAEALRAAIAVHGHDSSARGRLTNLLPPAVVHLEAEGESDLLRRWRGRRGRTAAWHKLSHSPARLRLRIPLEERAVRLHLCHVHDIVALKELGLARRERVHKRCTRISYMLHLTEVVTVGEEARRRA